MSLKQVERVRCGDCGAEVELPASVGQGVGLIICCRACGAELYTDDSASPTEPESWPGARFCTPHFVSAARTR